MKYVCELCGYEYDEAQGVPETGLEAGIPFDKLPEDFVCPLCGAGKEAFYQVE